MDVEHSLKSTSSKKNFSPTVLTKPKFNPHFEEHSTQLKNFIKTNCPTRNAFRFYRSVRNLYVINEKITDFVPNELIMYFFQLCEEANILEKTLELPFDNYEKNSFVYFLKEHIMNPSCAIGKNPKILAKRDNIIVVFYIQYSLFNELNEWKVELEKRSSAEALSKEREQLIKVAQYGLPNITPLKEKQTTIIEQGLVDITSVQSETKKSPPLKYVSTPYNSKKIKYT